MRRRSAQSSAQRMIRDYLGQVSTAALRLPKGDRQVFVRRIMSALQARVGLLSTADDADVVIEALRALGDPEDLAKQEQERIKSRRRGGANPPVVLWKPHKDPGRGTRPEPPAPRTRTGGGPWKPRPWPSRRSAAPGESAAGESAAEGGSAAPGPGIAGGSAPGGAPGGKAGEAGRSAAPGGSWPFGGGGTTATPGPVVGPGTSEGAAAPPGGGAVIGPGTAPGTWIGAVIGPGTTRGPGASPAAGTGAVIGPGTGPGRAGAAAAGASGPSAPSPSAPGAGPGPAVPGASGPAAPGTAAPGPAEPGAGAGGPAGNSAGITGPGITGGAGPGAGSPGAGVPGAGAAGAGGRPPAPDATASGDTEPISIVPGMAAAPEEEPVTVPPGRAGWPAVLSEAAALARKNPLEAACLLLIGVGGLFLPFPLWLIGGLAALRSRRWAKRERWIALAGPLVVAVACLLVLSATGSGNYFAALGHGLGHRFGLLLRVGCVVCAGYLLWRLRRGPRPRKTPPWLQSR